VENQLWSASDPSPNILNTEPWAYQDMPFSSLAHKGTHFSSSKMGGGRVGLTELCEHNLPCQQMNLQILIEKQYIIRPF
jgi:hypothetical protein